MYVRTPIRFGLFLFCSVVIITLVVFTLVSVCMYCMYCMYMYITHTYIHMCVYPDQSPSSRNDKYFLFLCKRLKVWRERGYFKGVYCLTFPPHLNTKQHPT